MRLANITSTFFVNLINRLGVRPPPDEGFLITNVVQPVSIVDADVTLSAAVTTAIYPTPDTNGLDTSAHAANTVLADTGQLSEGNWAITILIDAVDNAVNQRYAIEHRNAANTANIWSHTICPQVSVLLDWQFTFAKSFLLNERLRVINTVLGTGGNPYQATIFKKQMS